jgi:hypothetical protein
MPKRTADRHGGGGEYQEGGRVQSEYVLGSDRGDQDSGERVADIPEKA